MKKTRIEKASIEIQAELKRRRKELSELRVLSQEFNKKNQEYDQLCKVEETLWEFRKREIEEDLAENGIIL